MKRLSLILCLALGISLTNESFGQRKTYLGLKAGSNLSTAYFFHSFYGSDIVTGLESGVQGGIIAMNYLRNHVGLQAELLYTQKGWKQRFNDGTPDLITELDYIELPLLVNIHTGKEKLHFFANGGCFFEYLVKVKQNETPDPDNNYAFNESRDRKVGYGFRGGTGAFYDFNFGTILLEGSFSYSLSDMMDPVTFDSQVPTSSKNIVFGISLAYMFSFGEL